jgi:hypothetical protein
LNSTISTAQRPSKRSCSLVGTPSQPTLCVSRACRTPVSPMVPVSAAFPLVSARHSTVSYISFQHSEKPLVITDQQRRDVTACGALCWLSIVEARYIWGCVPVANVICLTLGIARSMSSTTATATVAASSASSASSSSVSSWFSDTSHRTASESLP